MVEVEPAPVDSTGTLHVSEELAELLTPYLVGCDNIAVRFTGRGLPTTATAVISEMYVELEKPMAVVRWYAIRVMIFGTPTGKTGANAYFKPVRTEMLKLGVAQAIPNGPIYNFREVYDDMEDSSNDMERLLHLADASFSKNLRHTETTRQTPEMARTPWWRKLF